MILGGTIICYFYLVGLENWLIAIFRAYVPAVGFKKVEEFRAYF